MSVYPMEEKDIAEISLVVNQAYEGSDDSGAVGWTHEKELIAPPRIPVHLKNPKEFVVTSDMNVFKFQENGKILGCVRVERHGTSADVSMLSVVPSLQARGVGSTLLKAAEDWARGKGCQTMEMAVVCHRKELQDYYKRRGYKETEKTIPFPIREGYGAPIIPLHFIVFEKTL